MIYIDVDELETMLPVGWLGRATDALKAVRDAEPADRSKTIAKYSHVWSELKEVLKTLSNEKCWYCESKNLRSDNAVDHFRPKGNVKDALQPHEGYWWLAFDWRNYRFCCTFCNSIRNSPTTSGGKQDYFPINDENLRARAEADDILDELPLLIDPADRRDPALITFDENGAAAPASQDPSSLAYNRAEISIKRYHLNHPDVLEARIALFDQLKKWVKEADNGLTREAKGKSDGRLTAHQRLGDVHKALKAKAEYSSAARALMRSLARAFEAADVALKLP